MGHHPAIASQVYQTWFPEHSLMLGRLACFAPESENPISFPYQPSSKLCVGCDKKLKFKRN
jgi:hypothetical protein